jgi:internalin A
MAISDFLGKIKQGLGLRAPARNALQLIAENKRTRAKWLSLGLCRLKAVPAEIGELVWLEHLSLSDSRIIWLEEDDGWDYTANGNHQDSNSGLNDISALSGLTMLKSLRAYKTQVTDLRPLAGLTALDTLNIGETQVADLTPLSGLIGLRVLWAHDTQITSFAPLSGLAALETFSCAGTKIHDLAPLSALVGLKDLTINHTQVSDLTPLSNLLALKSLAIHNTNVTDLTPLQPLIRQGVEVKWDDHWSALGIHVEDCPLTTPPPEIVQQGNAAILNYFDSLKTEGTSRLFEAKMLILGEGGAGKTSLLRRLYHPKQTLPAEDETTKGIAIHRHDFTLKDGQPFRLNVWDFGGQEIYHATHQFFLTKRSLYILLDDTRKDNKTVSDPGFKYWLDVIDLFGGHSPVLLFQNEKGGRSKEIDLAGIKGQFDNVKECYRGNLEQDNAADTLRNAIEWFAAHLPHIGEELPASWVKVRADIERLAAQVPHITQQQYFDLFSQYLPFDRIKALHLSRYLHDLGVFLHFQDDGDTGLGRILILQNHWATEAVYRVLDDEAIKTRRGRFTLQDCQRLWADDKYIDMHPELLALMQRFELCYRLPHTEPKTWLAPQLLPATKPPALINWNQAADLVLRFRYGFLPKGMISRLMVRLHRFVREPDAACISTVLFAREATTLLAEALPDGNTIELRCRGPEQKILLGVVADEIDAMNAGFAGLGDKVDKLIPCHCPKCSALLQPHLFEEKALRQRLRDQRHLVECPKSYQDMQVQALLDGVHATQVPDWAAPSHARPTHITIHNHGSIGDINAAGVIDGSFNRKL